MILPKLARWRRAAALLCLLVISATFPAGARAQSLEPATLEGLTPQERQQLLDAYLKNQASDGADLQSARGNSQQAARDGATAQSARVDPVLERERRLQTERRLRQLRTAYRRFTDNPFTDNLQPFGYALFLGSAPTTFAPVDNVPVPSDYVLGPGDMVRVQIYENNSANHLLEITRDGVINLPGLGPIELAGLRFDEAQQAIRNQIEQRFIGAKADISLGRLRAIQVFLLGDVNQPGAYTISALSTISNALFAGGGISLSGSLREVQLKRGGTVVSRLDLYDLLIYGEATDDLRLQPGDVIFVPPVGPQVAVDGEVKRPAIYELDGEDTVGEAIELAGGLLASYSSSATIERVLPGQGRTIVDIGASGAIERSQPIRDGDAIKIKQIAPQIEAKVRIEGFVKYPGRYQWTPEMKLADLLRIASPLPSDSGEEAYFPTVLIERTSESAGVRRWSALPRLASGLVPQEELQPNDLVVLLSRADVEYLTSSDMRSVVVGEQPEEKTGCPGLEQLERLLSSQRASRLVQIFAAEKQWASSEERWNDNLLMPVDEPRKEQKPSAETRAPQLGQNLAQVPPQLAQQYGSSMAAAGMQVQPVDPYGQFYERNPAGSSTAFQLAERDLRMLEERRRQERERQCPELYRRLPQILPFLLEQSVAVFGEVRRPGLYPVADGTSLENVLDAAGGLTAEGDPGNVEYVSYYRALTTGSSDYQTLDVKAQRTLSMGIHSGDILNFRPVYVGQESGVVRLYGEVRFPGAYSIVRGERLSHVIERAGGLTDQAYPYGAVYTRQSARRAERLTNQRAAKDLREALVTAVTSGAMPQDSAASTQFLTGLVESLEAAPAVGRIVTETDPAVLSARPELDIVVEPGDRLYMPKRPATVTVTGQVLSQGTVAFVSGRDAGEYIEMAGGFTQGADAERAFIILPNGQAQRIETGFWNFSPADVPPGSYIVVPRDATPINGLVITERVLGIVSNLAVSAAALAVIGD